MIHVLVCLIAMVYAAVGHGGASGYLALLAAFTTASPIEMSTSALILNLFVAGCAWRSFWQAGHGSIQLIRPFLLGSVPFALLGGWLRVSSPLYEGLLAVVLAFAAGRLALLTRPSSSPIVTHQPHRGLARLVGGAIGLMSGIVGVGGGIVLSPLMILCRWADAKHTASASACFIVANSLAGLLGRSLAGQLDVGSSLAFIGPALVGGVVGSRLGAGVLPRPALCRTLAAVLMMAALKGVFHG
ncbi:MAG: sulfite exporter TauE/SafE family protein [Candidatus Omnitrophica bacterium]|nr:sulfite exporter TauE/SafE family protein [Candidatus Omnitrophota bacterium]